MAPILSKLDNLFSSHYRETIFFAWLSIVIASHHFAIKRNRTTVVPSTLENTPELQPQNEQVKVHGAWTKFTKTVGDKTGQNPLGPFEFCVPTFLRAIDLVQMSRLGKDYYKHNPPSTKIPALLFAAFCILPLAEFIITEDWSNPSKEDQKHRRTDLRYRLPLYLFTGIEIIATIATIKAIISPKQAYNLSIKDKLFLTLSLGFFNGALGITASHELIHKPEWFEKLLGYMLLCNVNYMHWGEEHLIGHHDNVATEKDPATARLNQSLYSFIPQTFVGSFLSSNEIEKERLETAGKSYFSFHNRMFWNLFLPAVWAGVVSKISKGGWRSVAVFYLQGFTAASMLEVVNYMEHYGLQREKLEDGSYEPVDPTHSWNSPHRLSNALLLKLQRHSDHHTYSMRPYHLLRNFKESPQLPSGYPGMYILCFFPPVFFWIMNPLVAAHERNKLRLKEEVKSSGGEYTFSKSFELETAELAAKRKLRGFLVGAAVVVFLWLRHSLKVQSRLMHKMKAL